VTPATFGERLALAIELADSSQSSLERDLGWGRGRVHRLLGKGKNPILSPGPEVVRALVDALDVEYEWLAIGRGPMRREGWDASALEEAMVFARKHGTRADAIEAAAAKHRDDPAELTAIEWILAFDAEARRLDRVGVPRPEETAQQQRTARRMSAKRSRLLRELAELDAREKVAPPPAASKPAVRARTKGAKR